MKVRFTKWGGRPHWHFDVDELGTDEHGRWFGLRQGTRIQRADEPPKEQPRDSVLLVPTTGCFIASWNATGRVRIYVDVSTAPVVTDTTIEAVDLDLDVIRLRSGKTRIIDEDEFALHQQLFDYPPWLVEQASATADWLRQAISARAEPFGRTGPHWLTRYRNGRY